MTTVEALHELRRMAQPTCWRCEGTGVARVRYDQDENGPFAVVTVCESCAGTGQPERQSA